MSQVGKENACASLVGSTQPTGAMGKKDFRRNRSTPMAVCFYPVPIPFGKLLFRITDLTIFRFNELTNIP